MQERRDFKKKLHVQYSLCPLTLIPNRQQKRHTGDIKFKENKREILRLVRGTGNVKKNLLAGREKGKKTMGKRSDGVGRCCSSGSGCACERHKRTKEHKKEEAAVKGALRLCIAVDHSRRWTAEIREDSRRRLSSRRRKRNGVCNEVMKFPKIWGRKKPIPPPSPRPGPNK